MLNWISRLFKGKQPEPALLWNDSPGVIALSDLGAGKWGEVVSIDTDRKTRTERLSAMGLTPGSRLIVKQKFPSIIIAVGETEIALDRAITQDIQVRPVAGETDPA